MPWYGWLIAGAVIWVIWRRERRRPIDGPGRIIRHGESPSGGPQIHATQQAFGSDFPGSRDVPLKTKTCGCGK